MNARRFFQRSIGAKIGAGYAISCVLLLAVGVLAVTRVSRIASRVEDMSRGLFVETSLLREVAAKAALARVYADAFVSGQSQDAINDFRANIQDLNAVLDAAESHAADQARLAVLRDIRASIGEYDADFTSLAELVRKRRRIAQTVLKVKTFLVENKLSAIRVNVGAQSDPRVFLAFGNAQNSFLQMLLQTSEYLGSGDEGHGVLFDKAGRQALASFAELAQYLPGERDVKNAREAGEAAQAYVTGFDEIRRDYREGEKLRRQEMRPLEARIGEDVESVNKAIAQQVNLHDAAARAMLGDIRNELTVVVALALCGSLALGAFVSRRITEPLKRAAAVSKIIADEDLKGLTERLASLSGGDLRTGFKVSAAPLRLEQHDEIGRLARDFDAIVYQLVEAERAFARMADYLERMTATAQAVARGDLDLNVPVASKHDRLGNAVAGMVAGLKAAEGRLLDYQRSLEDTVAARTAQVEALRRKLQDVIEFLPDAIFVVDAQGKVFAWNRALEKLTGVSKESVVGKGRQACAMALYGEDRPLLIDFVHRGAAQEAMGLFGSLEQTETGWVAETYLSRAYHGRGAHVWLSAAPLYDENGQIVGGIECLLDITERKRIERELADSNRMLESTVNRRTRSLRERTRELEAANERLLELDKLKSAFVASVSHELRTPLTSLLGFAKMIRKDVARLARQVGENDDEEKRRERILGNVDIIVAEGERLARLINDVLDLNRIESGDMVWHDAALDVGEAVMSAAAAMRHAIEANPAVSFELEIAPGLPPVTADRDKIVQVLVNLLSNAVKFTSQGTIGVAARPCGEGRVEIAVSDTGVGIAPEDLPKVFERFRQIYAADTLRDKPKGAGLGLFICKQIVERYAGSIQVESEPGRGSVFRVFL